MILQCIPRDGPFPKPRGTDPINPLYVLASTSSATPPVAAAGIKSRPCSAVSRDHMKEVLQPQMQQQDSTPARDVLNVTDIAGAQPKALLSTGAVKNFKLDTSDIEGTWPGWKPPFR